MGFSAKGKLNMFRSAFIPISKTLSKYDLLSIWLIHAYSSTIFRTSFAPMSKIKGFSASFSGTVGNLTVYYSSQDIHFWFSKNSINNPMSYWLNFAYSAR